MLTFCSFHFVFIKNEKLKQQLFSELLFRAANLSKYPTVCGPTPVFDFAFAV